MVDLVGNELFPNALVGLDGNNYPAAVTEQKSAFAVAGAGSTFSSAQVNAASSITLVNVTGLSQKLNSGTYAFRIVAPGTSGAVGGMQFAFNYTSLTVTSLTAQCLAFTAAGVAATVVTSTTAQAALVSSSSALTTVMINGTLSTAQNGGTVQLQFAQGASSASTSSVYAGAFMQFVKIGT